MGAGVHARFSVLVDPRMDRTRRHRLIDIRVIALSAAICGAAHFTEMEAFGKAREALFRAFPGLPGGTPSRDTFRRALSLPDPAQFQACFLNRARDAARLRLGEVIAIDGARSRRLLAGWDERCLLRLAASNLKLQMRLPWVYCQG